MVIGSADPAGDETATVRQHRDAFEAAHDALLEAVGLEATSRFVDLGGPYGTVHVLESGQGADDIPAVFVHGTGGSGRSSRRSWPTSRGDA